MKFFYSLIFFLICFTCSLSSKDALSYYEEAYRIEKISPLLSIPLYEKALSIKPDRQTLKTVVSRLRFLYLKFSKTEEIFLLHHKFGSEFAGNKNSVAYIQKVADDIGVSPSMLSRVVLLSLRRSDTLGELLQIINTENNKKLFRFIFSLKMRLKDYDTLKKIFELNQTLDPFLRLALFVKTESEEAENELDKLGSDEPLSSKRKSDLLYLKGVTLRNKKQMKLSARFFLMSASYSRKDRGFGEAAKTLIASGKKTEGCKLIESPIKVENETDELLVRYCNEKNPKTLRPILTVVKILSEKDKSPFVTRLLNEI